MFFHVKFKKILIFGHMHFSTIFDFGSIQENLSGFRENHESTRSLSSERVMQKSWIDFLMSGYLDKLESGKNPD